MAGSNLIGISPFLPGPRASGLSFGAGRDPEVRTPRVLAEVDLDAPHGRRDSITRPLLSQK